MDGANGACAVDQGNSQDLFKPMDPWKIGMYLPT